MIDLDKLRTERDALQARWREILEEACGTRASEAQMRELSEIQERLAAIADELIGPCIVV